MLNHTKPRFVIGRLGVRVSLPAPFSLHSSTDTCVNPLLSLDFYLLACGWGSCKMKNWSRLSILSIFSYSVRKANEFNRNTNIPQVKHMFFLRTPLKS